MQTKFRHPKRNPDGSFWRPRPRGRKPRARGEPVVAEDGTIRWYYKRKLHREGGLPAVEHPDGSKWYYWHGKYRGAEGPSSTPVLPAGIPDPDPVVGRDGTTRYERNGSLHRACGPAWIHWSGAHKWYLNGQLHREDGPAWIVPRLFARYYRDGRLHRDDGPAVVYAQGSMEWYRDGRLVCSRPVVHPPARPVRRIVPMETVEEAEASAASIVGDEYGASRCMDALLPAALELPVFPTPGEEEEKPWGATETNFIPAPARERAV